MTATEYSDTVILSCPDCRCDAGITNPSPAAPGSYYYCASCDEEWYEPRPDDRNEIYRDLGMALAALTWMTFQLAVMLTFTLGFALVLHQNYGYASDDLPIPATGYAFLFFIFWITILFPALFDLVTTVGRYTWRAIWGTPL
jgi:uncharacterized BrkB/YihY/UPF0761 family membrane protein